MKVSEFKPALGRAIEKYYEEVKVARAAEADLVNEVLAGSGAVPNNHWQTKHKAEAKLYAACLLMEALDDIEKS